MKDAYYFSHDANARHDIKIQALILRYGMAGYGIWWVIVEMLREQEEYMLPRKQYMWASIAKETMMTPEQAEEFIEDCVNEFELLEYDDGHFFAPSLKKRMEHLDSVRKKRKKAADKRWDEQNNDEQCKCNANAMQNDAKESKVKESKVKEEYAPDITMTEEEYNKLIVEYDKKYIDALLHRMSQYQAEHNKTYTSHYRTALNWVKKDEQENKAVKVKKKKVCPKCGKPWNGYSCHECLYESEESKNARAV